MQNNENKKSKVGIIIAIVTICAIVCALFMLVHPQKKGYYDYTGKEYMKLGRYRGLTYTKEEVKVTENDLKERIKSETESRGTVTDVTEGTVRDGDTVKIDYTGKIDGKEFEGGSAKDYVLLIGSKSFIDGFEDGLIGKDIGDKVTLNLKFPKDYQDKDVAGKDVTFDVTIKAKQVTNKPKYDDDFIKNYTKYKSKEEYEENLKKTIKKEKEQTAEFTAKQTVFGLAVNNAKIKKYPEKELEEEKKIMLDQYKTLAKQYNVEWGEFLKNYVKSTEQELEKTIEANAKTSLKTKMVVAAIAEKENIEVTDKEYDKYLKDLIKNANLTEKTFKEAYGKDIKEYADENGMRASLLQEKVIDFIYSKAKAK